jgi:hypothetical protein
MVSDISGGLPEFRSNLTEGVAFEEMEPEGPSLVLRECLKCPLQAPVSEPSGSRIFKSSSAGSRVRKLAGSVVKVESGVKVAKS